MAGRPCCVGVCPMLTCAAVAQQAAPKQSSRKGVTVRYAKPEVVDFGGIGEHTFDNPGKGDKSDNPNFETDKFGEFSHPAGSP